MRECRFYPWCSYIEDHGCTKDSCRNYQPMPDVDALLALTDELDERKTWSCTAERSWSRSIARRIREALGMES